MAAAFYYIAAALGALVAFGAVGDFICYYFMPWR